MKSKTFVNYHNVYKGCGIHVEISSKLSLVHVFETVRMEKYHKREACLYKIVLSSVQVRMNRDHGIFLWYSQILLLWHWWNRTGAGLSDNTYADLNSCRHFLLLLLYVSFTTNERSIPYGSLVHVMGQSHQRFLLCFVKSLHTCRIWWIGSKGVRRYHSG